MLKGSVLGHVAMFPASFSLLGRWSIVAQKVPWSPGLHYQKEHLGFLAAGLLLLTSTLLCSFSALHQNEFLKMQTGSCHSSRLNKPQQP